MRIADKEIGTAHPCFIIAEAGVNHNGDPDMALALVEAAVRAGVDAVKFQTFLAAELVTAWAPKAPYQVDEKNTGETQFEMLRKLELSREAHNRIGQCCKDQGIIFLSTPFDPGSVDLLEELDIPAFKIPSGEVTNTSLIRHIGLKGRPVILSTGMSDLVEIGQAVSTLEETGNRDIVLLHCVSSYPALPEEMNLRAMETLKNTFGYTVGLSDHTLGTEIAIAAVALGASVLEKHFTLDKGLPGPDHQASLDPGELASMVAAIRKVEAALGTGCKVPVVSESETARAVRKSLVASRAISAGTVLVEEMITIRRPGTGMPPTQIVKILGKETIVDIEEGQMLTEDLVR